MHHPASASRHRRQGRRAAAIIATVGALGSLSTTTSPTLPAVAAPAEPAAGQAATRIYTLRALPGEDVFPSGVAVDGDTYYVTTAVNGGIYRGDLDEPEIEAEEFIDTGFGLAGIKVVGQFLLVGRREGVSLYDRGTGASVATWFAAEGSLAADIAIAPTGDAYILDQNRPVLYRIPAAQLRNPPAAEQELPIFLDYHDSPIPFTDGFAGLAGFVLTPDGRYVLAVHGTTGQLFRVRLSDKQVTPVDLGRYRLISGSGMVITDDRVLYVVRPARPVVTKLRLDDRYQRARVLSETTDPSFRGPWMAAIAGDRLLVTNLQFFSGAPPSPPWTVSSIPLP